MFMDENFSIIPYASYEFEGITHSKNIFDLWGGKELSTIGIFKVEWGDVPPDKEVVEWTYKKLKYTIKATPILKDIEESVPQKVSKAQGKSALLKAGLYFETLSFIDSLPEGEKELALIAFNDTNEWSRDSPFLKACAGTLNLTEDDLDNLFIEAHKIVL